MEQPFFSIIIPVFNTSGYLEFCLDSIIKQEFTDWECVLVDDGSSDGSEKICGEYAEKDSRFKVFHQKNSGVSAARNFGLDKADGEWIWFIDSDDVIHPRSLKILCKNIKRDSKLDFVYFDYVTGERIFFEPEKNVNIQVALNNIPEMSQWRCIFKKEIARNLKFEKFIIGEDLLFCAKVSGQAQKIGYLAEKLYGYVIRNSSVMRTPSFRRTMDQILWQTEILKYYAGVGENLYSHLYNSRWHKFFFVCPTEIVKYSGSDYETLVCSWFSQLGALRSLKTYYLLAIWRKMYLVVGHWVWTKKILLKINNFCCRLVTNCNY